MTDKDLTDDDLIMKVCAEVLDVRRRVLELKARNEQLRGAMEAVVARLDIVGSAFAWLSLLSKYEKSQKKKPPAQEPQAQEEFDAESPNFRIAHGLTCENLGQKNPYDSTRDEDNAHVS